MTSLARSTSSALGAIRAFDQLRASLLACKEAAPRDLRLAFQDMHDIACRIQAELCGSEASTPLSAVEALGLRRGVLTDSAEPALSIEAGIAAGIARSALDRAAGRVSITSETYMRRLFQFLAALSRTPSWQR